VPAPSGRRRYLHLRSYVILLVAATLAASPATADPLGVDEVTQPVRREILALYDGREEPRSDLTRIHRFAEMPLNYLGFVVTYWDISVSLPDAERTANINGILTWFQRAEPAAFYLWALPLVKRGARMVVLGDGGVGEAPPPEANRLFEQIGFRMSGDFVDLTYATRVLHRDALIGFEQKLDPALPAYPIVGAFGPGVTSHLVFTHRGRDAALTSSVVLTSPRGGYAATGSLIYEEPYSGITKWVIDPFAFFQKAYGVRRAPIPDVTTLSGRRIYFSHIDGDGWNNVSRIQRFYDKRTISAEVVLRELIAPYPDLPVSVGVIGADVDDKYGQVQTARRVTRELFALPQVEVATHTYTHPYEWPFFETYDRDLEERVIGNGDAEWPTVIGDRVRKLAKRLFPGLARDPHEHKLEEEDPPRAFSDYPFDLDQETRGAVAAAEALAPSGKRTALYLWSGGAEPFEAAIAATRKLGVRNMNGGDSRLDADYPSISYLSPLARAVGAERQIYAGEANDFLFTTDGDGRDHGYLHLQATIAATEEPRRLKPVNIYYHMYAGERAAQLAAVRHHLDVARQSLLTPVAASQYPAIVEGFFTTTIAERDPSTWVIRNRGALGTVRFDDADDFAVDFARSIGVLGEHRKGKVLYVALDAAYDDVVLALALKPISETSAPIPHLIDARWTFRDLIRRDCGFTVGAQGFGPGQMTWGGLAPGLYWVSVHEGATPLWSGSTEVGADGRLALTAAADATRPVAVEVACSRPKAGD
jgi:polysaccharide biosynthesis protein PelA